MIELQSIEITSAALDVVERRHAQFRPATDKVPALAFLSMMTDRDGSTVTGFVPGFWFAPWSRQDLTARCAVVSLAGGVEFYLIPRSPWRATERYFMDLASAEYETFSIEMIGR